MPKRGREAAGRARGADGEGGGAADAVEHGKTGLIIDPPNDPDAVASALEELLTNEEMRSEMGVASRERAERYFSYAHLAKKLEDGISSAEIDRR